MIFPSNPGIISDADWWTLKAMETYGGSFVKLLAELAWRADSENLIKIKNTWSLYWSTYEKDGLLMQRAHENGERIVPDAPTP